MGAALGIPVVVLSGVIAWSFSHREPLSRATLTDKDTIVLADFDNKTGDPVFEGSLRQGLAAEDHLGASSVADPHLEWQGTVELDGLARLDQSRDQRLAARVDDFDPRVGAGTHLQQPGPGGGPGNGLVAD